MRCYFCKSTGNGCGNCGDCPYCNGKGYSTIKAIGSGTIQYAGNKTQWDVCQIGVELASEFSNNDAEYEAIWTATQNVFNLDTMAADSRGNWDRNNYCVHPSQRARYVSLLASKLTQYPKPKKKP